MTQDFIDDFIEACRKEGATYFLSVSTDKGNSIRFYHNYDELPKFREYPDGAIRTQKEDYIQFLETVEFHP